LVFSLALEILEGEDFQFDNPTFFLQSFVNSSLTFRELNSLLNAKGRLAVFAGNSAGRKKAWLAISPNGDFLRHFAIPDLDRRGRQPGFMLRRGESEPVGAGVLSTGGGVV